ncbi:MULTISPECIES: NlpC/P60 family protein [unclassified Halomonas]|uniref:NlpC/P60 family protein n=1 Tax=unclassified Halomonas TaxID=2609666 RepID=UPI000945A79A|nr:MULTISPECIES: NlpC/P60 family protein [unclassified Halomonas]
MLSGCAGNAPQDDAPDDYFARSLPGLPADWEAQMSPHDGDNAAFGDWQGSPIEQVREALLSQHEEWVGTPYRLGGTSQRGIDCSALVRNIFRDTFELDLPRSTRGQIHEGRSIDRQSLRAGDLVFFRPPGAYDHVGIYVGDGHFLHASTSKGVIISSLDNSYWNRYYWQSRRPLAPSHLAKLNDTPQTSASRSM